MQITAGKTRVRDKNGSGLIVSIGPLPFCVSLLNRYGFCEIPGLVHVQVLS